MTKLEKAPRRLLLWNENIEKLNEFETLFNASNVIIQFLVEYNHKQHSFLDILIKKANKQIKADIYYKQPMDFKQYRSLNSCHPRHTKMNVPYNLVKRICTIVSGTNIRL